MKWTIADYLKEEFREILECNSRENTEYYGRVLTEDIEDIVEELVLKVTSKISTTKVVE